MTLGSAAGAEWLHGHAHEPNPSVPAGDGTLRCFLPDGRSVDWSVDALQRLPVSEVAGCSIVSTGHGTSGPFTFGGVSLRQFLADQMAVGAVWAYADAISADGFGARLLRAEVEGAPLDRPVLLAYRCNGQPLTRQQGLVRLIVPTEQEDALKQVKWLAQLVVR